MEIQGGHRVCNNIFRIGEGGCAVFIAGYKVFPQRPLPYFFIKDRIGAVHRKGYAFNAFTDGAAYFLYVFGGPKLHIRQKMYTGDPIRGEVARQHATIIFGKKDITGSAYLNNRGLPRPPLNGRDKFSERKKVVIHFFIGKDGLVKIVFIMVKARDAFQGAFAPCPDNYFVYGTFPFDEVVAILRGAEGSDRFFK